VCGNKASGPEACTFKCFQGHTSLTCGKCKSSFQDKCKEVSLKIEEAYKQHEELYCSKFNKGRAEKLVSNTLSKLSPNAREQKKQFDRAESSGALLCPADAPDDRSMLVPYCAHVLTPLNLEKQEDANGKRNKPSASKSKLSPEEEASKQTAAPLVDDADLILIQPAQSSSAEGADDVLARGTARMKKKQGKSKNQRQRIHLLEAYQDFDDSGAEDSTPVSNRHRAAFAALQSPTLRSWVPPEPTRRDIDELADMLKIDAVEARKLLTAAGGSPEAAVTAFFAKNAATATDEPNDQPARSGTTSTPVTQQESFARVAALPADAQSRGTSASSTAKAALPADAQSRGTSASSSTAKAHSSDASGCAARDLPPPGRPPPPLVPQGWKAQWCAAENKYYYWNQKTFDTQWAVPTDDVAAPERGQVQAQSPKGASAAAAVAPAARPASPVGPRISQALVEELSNITGCSPQESIEYLVGSSGNLEAAVRAAGANQKTSKGASSLRSSNAGTNGARAVEPPPCTPKLTAAYETEYLCVQNWQPTRNAADAAVCLSLVHGERMRVAWTDEKQDGWAYVEIVGSDVKGYCPQAILVPAPPAPKPLAVGDRFRVRVSFREPQHEKGYVPVEPGDEVIVEHQVEEPVVWAYVTRTASHLAPAQRGWLPVCVLYDSMGCGPARAG